MAQQRSRQQVNGTGYCRTVCLQAYQRANLIILRGGTGLGCNRAPLSRARAVCSRHAYDSGTTAVRTYSSTFFCRRLQPKNDRDYWDYCNRADMCSLGLCSCCLDCCLDVHTETYRLQGRHAQAVRFSREIAVFISHPLLSQSPRVSKGLKATSTAVWEVGGPVLCITDEKQVCSWR